ncbi:MAG: MFS transporter [Porphyromonas sp.]|nr:MFS transporter [Porphyromonas sp.]
MKAHLSSQERTRTDYLFPFVTMVVLMALIGFITSINQQFQAPIKAAFLQSAGHLNNALATLLNFAFFLAYLLMGPVSARYLDRNGYKKTIVFGLVLLAFGVAFFELSALQFEYLPLSPLVLSSSVSIPLSYFIFLIGSFVCGAGLTYMQSSVNPYVIACDVRGTSGVQRQNIAGTFNSTMTAVGPLFVSFLVFRGAEVADLKISSILLPLCILFAAILLLSALVSRLQLPHIEGTTAFESKPLTHSVWSFRHLTLGVVAIFTYVGVEVCVGANINHYAMDDLGYSLTEAASLASIYWFFMLIGRLMGSFLSRVNARVLLAVSTSLAIVLMISFYLLGASSFSLNVGVMEIKITLNLIGLILTGLCHSVMWGAIFALATDGLGHYTARGTGALMMGVVGGAVLPFLQGVLADVIGGWHYTWIIILLGELYMLYYALSGSRVKE